MDRALRLGLSFGGLLAAAMPAHANPCTDALAAIAAAVGKTTLSAADAAVVKAAQAAATDQMDKGDIKGCTDALKPAKATLKLN